MDASEKVQILFRAQRWVECDGLRHQAELPRRLDAATGWLEDSGDHFDRRGFAGTVRAEQAKDLAAPEGERNGAYRFSRPEALRERVDVQKRVIN